MIWLAKNRDRMEAMCLRHPGASPAQRNATATQQVRIPPSPIYNGRFFRTGLRLIRYMSTHPYPIARIGLIGGGQLGRMTVAAAKRVGCACIVLDPVEGSPAGELAGHQIIGGYHDADKIRELAANCDVLTFELENIGADTLAELEAEGHAVHPSPAVLKTIQDKLTQKRFLADHEIPTSEFEAVEQPSPRQFAAFGYPLVQKVRQGG